MKHIKVINGIFLLLLSALCILTHISNAQIKRVIPVNPSLVKTPGGVRTPQNLVCVYLIDTGNTIDQPGPAGPLIKQSTYELEMTEFSTSRQWIFKKDPEGVFSYSSSPKLVGIKVTRVFISKPQGPVINPTAQNMPAMTYVAICLSNGKNIYARISGKFSTPKGYSGPAGGGYVYLQADTEPGPYYEIKLHWDPASQKWVAIPADTKHPDLKAGTPILAVYSYYDLSSPFYQKP